MWRIKEKSIYLTVPPDLGIFSHWAQLHRIASSRGRCCVACPGTAPPVAALLWLFTSSPHQLWGAGRGLNPDSPLLLNLRRRQTFVGGKKGESGQKSIDLKLVSDLSGAWCFGCLVGSFSLRRGRPCGCKLNFDCFNNSFKWFDRPAHPILRYKLKPKGNVGM